MEPSSLNPCKLTLMILQLKGCHCQIALDLLMAFSCFLIFSSSILTGALVGCSSRELLFQ